MTRRMLVLVTGLAALLALPALLEGVFITPHAVFLDDENRAAQVTVGVGDAAEEVTIDFLFGFPDTDSLGTPFVRLIEDPDSSLPSAVDWLRAFPRRVRLEPDEQQTVRLLAAPPPNLPDGEYWARLVVTSRGVSMPVASADTTVQAALDIVFRILVPVTFRKGNLTTGVLLTDLEASAAGDSLVVRMAVERLGNAAYLGTARVDVLAEDGERVREWVVPLAVYTPLNRRFVFRGTGLPPGAYRLAFRLLAERDDLSEDDVLPAPTVGDTVAFAVP